MDWKNTLRIIIFIYIALFSLSCSSVKKEMGKARIQKKIIISASKSAVWSAFTKEAELSKWWNKGVKIEPRVGGEFYEPWGKGQLATGKVFAVKPFEYIQFTWKEKYWKSGAKTVCRFSLKEKSGKTTLEVTHFGWESFQDLETKNKLIEGFKGGWDSILSKIKIYVEGKGT